MRKKTDMRFKVTHHLPGHDASTHTLTDAAGVKALLHQAARTGSRLHIRPCAPGQEPPAAAAHHAEPGTC
jgi:hypothetical protein